MLRVKTSVSAPAFSLVGLTLLSVSCHHTAEPCAPPVDYSSLASLPAGDYVAAVKRVREVCGGDLTGTLNDWLDAEARGERRRTIPDDLASSWAEACPKVPAASVGMIPATVERLVLVRDCGEAAFGLPTGTDPRVVEQAVGNPVLALLVRQRLAKVASASAHADGVARALVGPLPYPAGAPITLPSFDALAGEAIAPATSRVVLTGPELLVDGKSASKADATLGRFAFPLGGGPWDGWRVTEWTTAREPAGAPATLAVEASAPAEDLLRLAATVAEPGAVVRVLATAQREKGPDAVGALELLLPSDTAEQETDRLRVLVDRAGVDVLSGETLLHPQGECAIRTFCERIGEGSFGTSRVPAALRTAIAPLVAASDKKLVTLQVDPNLRAQDLVAAASALRLAGGKVVLDLDEEPCVNGWKGMACVPGGPTHLGDAADKRAPVRAYDISTFYLDKHEVTVGEYRACVEGGGQCAKPSGFPARADTTADALPVSGVSWDSAVRYCAWAGKRLPTEFEWEKAAALSWPAPDAKADCAYAWHAGCSGVKGPRPAAEGKPGDVLGIVNLAGNVAEWTSNWIEPVGKAGSPLGPCGGAQMCSNATQKVVRGGSWSSKADDLRPSKRTAVSVGPLRNGGLRCAVSGGEGEDPPAFLGRGTDIRSPVLTRWPPRQVSAPPADPGALTAPSAEELAIAQAVLEDDIEDKPICAEEVVASWNFKGGKGKGGRSETTCRDPASYPYTNEKKTHVFRRYAQNLGGGYTGVGSDQNYDFIAAARSRWVWLFDYDPNVVKLHRALKPLILAAATPEEFLAFFQDKNVERGADLIRDYYKGDKKGEIYRRAFIGYHRLVGVRYEQKAARKGPDPEFGWLSDPARYAYIRTLHQQGRIIILGGDMLANKGMQSIGAAARKLGIPMRIFYTSNAPTSWGGQVTPNWRANVKALPFDDASVILVTWNHGSFAGKNKDYWHYQVQRALTYQERLQNPGYVHMFQLIWDRIPSDDPDTTLLNLPSE